MKIRPMRSILAGLALAGALAVGARPAEANIVISTGGGGGGANVLFPVGDIVANSILGEVQQTNEPVQFDSTQFIVAPSGGQARVESRQTSSIGSAHIPQTNISFMLTNPNLAMTEVVFNPFIGGGVGGDSTLKITVTGTVSPSQSFAISNGNNFFTITADSGDYFTKVSLEVTQGDGYADLRQVRIPGTTQIPSNPVPEPATLLSAGASALICGFLALRARRRNAN